MAGRLLRRRAAAAAGSYLAIALGFAGTVVAARLFTTKELGLYTLVIASTGFFQSLLDLTIEEALIKYGFRYVTSEDWGRLRRLFRQTFAFKLVGAVLGGLALLALASAARPVFGHAELRLPLAIGAAIPLLQAPEGISAVPLMLRGRYDVRGGFLALSMALRLAAIAAGASFGLAWTIAAIAAAQAAASLAISVAGWRAFRRFPVAVVRTLGDDAREIVRFVVQSSGATGAVSLRSTLTPIVLGIVSTPIQVAYFKVAQAPQQGFNAVSAPIRLVMLTEQTRDWERGERARVFAGIRRYALLATLGAAALLPPLLLFMPELVRLLFGAKNLGAVTAARIIVVAGAVQFVVGWSKSFAVTAGRPQWRIWTHGIETAVLLPLAILLGWRWGAAGAAAAVLVASVAFAIAWVVLLQRIRREPLPQPRTTSPTEPIVAATEGHL
jgi:O-antigen/teichoic acid export membrane protein